VAPRLTKLAGFPGVRVGVSADESGATGVTVVRFARPAPTVVDVRGGAAATYDTASLSLESTFGRRWAIFLTGGSLFGLDAAAGIRSRLLEEGDGHRAFRHPQRLAPISGAALFDLPRPPRELPDYRALGYEAARRANADPVPSGPSGAGTGATIGKYRGRGFASPGGQGSAAVRVPGLGRVGVLTVLNSVGAVRDPADGRWVAGARDARGRLVPPRAGASRESAEDEGALATNLAVVVVDAPLTRGELQRVAILAHTGFARCVVPVNTATDGDVIFAASVAEGRRRPAEGRPGAHADRVGMAAADLVVTASLGAFS
jgi:L-aminopeptidase/D-esterase-like protein